MKSTYLIKLTIYISEFEKKSTHLVTAESREAAELKAFRDESHFDDAGFKKGVWHDGCMQYRARSIVLLSDELAVQLGSLL